MASGASGGTSGNYNKVGALLLAGMGGIAGFIIFSGGGGNDSLPPPTSVPQVTTPQVAAPQASVPTRAPASSSPQPGSIDREALRGGDPNSVVLTITAYGMPARVSAQAQNAGEVKSQGMFDAGRGTNFACVPDTQYPNPCVTYLVVQRGAPVTVTAGDARAGFWPVLDSLRGGGCDRTGTGADVTCSLMLFQDADIIATYYGSDTPSGRYQFPKCPVGEARARAAASSSWVARCQ